MPLKVPAPPSEDDRLAQILDQYLTSLDGASPPDLEELAAEHPEFAAEIRSMAASLHLLHCATKPMQVASEDSAGAPLAGTKQLGDYRIGPEIGRGGMGVVYEAQQISLQRQVALKVLPFAAMWDQKQIARFRNEALAAAQLHHPHIVPVFAVGEERGVHYYAMQYIDGRSLDQVVREVRQQPLPEEPTQPKSRWGATTVLGHTTQFEKSQRVRCLPSVPMITPGIAGQSPNSGGKQPTHSITRMSMVWYIATSNHQT